MIWTEQLEQQAHHLAENLTEKQWDVLMDFAGLLINPIKLKESLAEKTGWDREQEKEKSRAARKEIYINTRVWLKERIGDFKIPSRYDLGSQEMLGLIRIVAPTPIVDRNSLWDGLSVMYDYGFKRGIAYQKNQSKKKRT